MTLLRIKLRLVMLCERISDQLEILGFGWKGDVWTGKRVRVQKKSAFSTQVTELPCTEYCTSAVKVRAKHGNEDRQASRLPR